VLYGHHDDLAEGLEPLAEAAAVVNGLGEAEWMSAGAIAETNHSVRRSGNLIVVRPFSRRSKVSVSPETTLIQVLAPDDALDPGALTGWSLAGGPVHPFGTSVPLARGRVADVRLHARDQVDPGRVPAPAWRPWPRLRRAVTEARDRALPLVS
jgi:hypothetical protein